MSKNKKDTQIVCPVCGETSEIIRISSITVNEIPLMLHEDVGEIYQCTNPDCLEYLVKVHDRYEHITRIEILRRQKEITELLARETEFMQARLAPKATMIAAKAEMGEALAPVLYRFTSESPYHRAYTVEELLGACDALGLNSRNVSNDTIGFVLTWLKENKD